MTEEWRQLRDYKYEVSSLGKVRRTGGKILKQIVGTKGYLRLGISDLDRRKVWVEVHVVVAEVFIGPRPIGLQVAHLDGDKTNNIPANLRYMTPKENEHMKFQHGTARIGERGVSAKLSNADVAEIRSIGKFKTAAELAKSYGIHIRYVHSLRSGRWRKYG